MEFLIPIFGILLVMIPVAGLTLALTLRLAVKPLVETLATALRESKTDAGAARLENHLVALTEELETLAHEVRELKSAHDFDRKLLAERDEPATTGPQSPDL